MKNVLRIVIFLFLPSILHAQDSLKFQKEIADLTANDQTVNTKDLILFTGSSTIRKWTDINTYFPTYNVLNRGFGGSQMIDLLYNVDKLIIPYKPVQVFIYEGDNDLGAKKTTEEILQQADEILTIIRKKLPKNTKVVFISPKPSLARWQLKPQFEAYNVALKAWTKKKKVGYVDAWTPMLDANGEVMKDIFIEDGLHMNKKGYDIWGKMLAPYVGK